MKILSHNIKVSLKIPEQFLCISMFWKQAQSFVHISETLLELSTFVMQISQVENGFVEECGRASCRLKVRF